MWDILQFLLINRVSRVCSNFTYAARCNYYIGAKERKGSDRRYDIIIIGGGLVGTTMACAISKQSALCNKRVLLLEASANCGHFAVESYSNRVSALNHGSVKLLKRIGAWNAISTARYKRVKQMQVWDSYSTAAITFNHKNFSDEVAFIVENNLILNAVHMELEKSKNVEVIYLAKIKKIQLIKDGAETNIVHLEGNKVFESELLIGADGINSLVRKQMRINNYSIQYKQLGLVATVELSEAGDNSVAWQRFIPTGPIALLPLNNNLSSLVWTTTPNLAEDLKKMPEADFVDELNQAFVKKYSKDSLVTNILQMTDLLLSSNIKIVQQYPPRIKRVLNQSRACFPLGFFHSSSYIDQGVVLIGDAAHRIHPLAGQGVNLGFGDIQTLTEKLCDARYSGHKLGATYYLLQYESERLQKNLPIMIGVHGLQRIYNTSFPPIVALRSAGVQIINNVEFIKNIFMQRAMG